MDIASKTHKKIAIIIIINYYYHQDSHTVSAFFFLFRILVSSGNILHNIGKIYMSFLVLHNQTVVPDY